MSWPSDDDLSARIAIVQLSALGIGTYKAIAKAFRIHEKSVYNYIQSFSEKGAYGLIPEKGGPRGSWKLNARLRSAILFLALNRGMLEYEQIKKQLDDWGESVSVPSIRQVLLENGIIEGMNLPEPTEQPMELFDAEDERQGHLDFGEGRELQRAERTAGIESNYEKPEGGLEFPDHALAGIKRERSFYSQSQRAYLDQLERGEYNAYAGGLLFAPLLEKYSFLPTLRRIVDMETYEGYSLEELCLTLFYLDSFGFR